MKSYKFNTMFRGQAVVIEYYYTDSVKENEIDCAAITYDNPYIVRPNREWDSNRLYRFHLEVYELAKNHIKKVVRNV